MKILKSLFVFLFFISLASPVNATENDFLQDEKIIVELVYKDSEIELKDLILDDGSRLGDYDYDVRLPKLRINTTLGVYFNSVAWITRDGLLSLSLNPKYDVRANYYTKETAWNVLKSPSVGFGYDPRFYNNQQTLKNQYDCHFNNAFYKPDWNLEPSRSVVDWYTMLTSGCNPS